MLNKGELHLSFLDIHNDLCYFLGLWKWIYLLLNGTLHKVETLGDLIRARIFKFHTQYHIWSLPTALWKSLFESFFLIWGIRAQLDWSFASSLIFGKLHREDWMFAGFKAPFLLSMYYVVVACGEDKEEWRKIGRRWTQTRLREKIP